MEGINRDASIGFVPDNANKTKRRLKGESETEIVTRASEPVVLSEHQQLLVDEL